MQCHFVTCRQSYLSDVEDDDQLVWPTFRDVCIDNRGQDTADDILREIGLFVSVSSFDLMKKVSQCIPFKTTTCILNDKYENNKLSYKYNSLNHEKNIIDERIISALVVSITQKG